MIGKGWSSVGPAIRWQWRRRWLHRRGWGRAGHTPGGSFARRRWSRVCAFPDGTGPSGGGTTRPTSAGTPGCAVPAEGKRRWRPQFPPPVPHVCVCVEGRGWGRGWGDARGEGEGEGVIQSLRRVQSLLRRFQTVSDAFRNGAGSFQPACFCSHWGKCAPTHRGQFPRCPQLERWR